MTTKACRVTYQGTRYQVSTDGMVRPTWIIKEHDTDGSARELPTTYKTRMFGESVDTETAKAIRHEAARQRRNRNARERNQAMKDLGLVRVRGALGSVYYE